ncbi:MAG: nicotinate-nucleotide diphosphorylase (carboxylating) [Armatimonadota bacterium]
MEPFLGDPPFGWIDTVEQALSEDLGTGDVTRHAVPEDAKVAYTIEAQADGVISGLGVANHLLGWLEGADPDEFVEWKFVDGDRIRNGDVVLEGYYNARLLLQTERTVLNFLMHLSGVATLTAKFVEAVQGTRAQITDTRKTLPCLRAFQKYAVRCGGGRNHRMSLSDGVLIKDNHIRAVGGIPEAIAAVRAEVSHTLKIEVECSTVAQVDRALSAGADVILLDNMSVGEMRDAVSICQGRAILEASGGITLETVREVAETGVDYISVGTLTHSAPSLPFHLEVR